MALNLLLTNIVIYMALLFGAATIEDVGSNTVKYFAGMTALYVYVSTPLYLLWWIWS